MGIDSRTRFTLPIKHLRFDWVQKSIPETIPESVAGQATKFHIDQVRYRPQHRPMADKKATPKKATHRSSALRSGHTPSLPSLNRPADEAFLVSFYKMSATKAAKIVRDAGIVKDGKLTALYR